MVAECRVSTTCPFCGVGCGMGLRTSGNRVVGVEPLPGHLISRGQLCAKGYAADDGIDLRDRIAQPLLRRGGDFEEVSWNRALAVVSEAFCDALSDLGPSSVGVISCARATNEDNYAAQKFARAALSTNNVDHCARICHSPSVAGLRQSLGSGAMTNSIDDLDRADLIVVFGADPTENHSVLGGRIIAAKLRGTQLLVVDPRKTRLARLADLHLQLWPGTNIALTNGLLHVIFAEGLENHAFLDARVDGLQAVKQKAHEYPPERVAAITGVAPARLQQAARMYARAPAAMLLYGMGVTQHTTGTTNVLAVSNLVLAAGQIGRPGTGINPLRGQNNVQGACDMGALPGVYPGYQSVADEAARAKFAGAWQRPLPAQPGLTSLGMQKATLDNAFRAMIIMGEDPVVTDPNQNHVRAALRALDMLVVFELTLTETARLADVVLPVASFAEKDGTFTNCERRVQRVLRAVPPPGQARSDWEILGELANRVADYEGLRWENAEAIFSEMSALTPSYSAMNYARIEAAGGLQWPCTAERPQGTPILHTERFPIGRARMLAVDHQGPAEVPDAEYPLCLTTQRLQHHYGCGSMTRKSPLLEREIPAGILFIHPDDARSLGLHEGSPVRVTSRRGMVETRAAISDDVPPGLVSMPYHFAEAPSNQLTNDAQDPLTKMPELKACAVRVDRLPPDVAPRSRAQIAALEEPT